MRGFFAKLFFRRTIGNKKLLILVIVISVVWLLMVDFPFEESLVIGTGIAFILCLVHKRNTIKPKTKLYTAMYVI